MSQTPVHNPPIRVTDLIELKKKGAVVICSPYLDIVPVDFAHRSCRFRALVFMCRFSGHADVRDYTFRKCYARGCARDECTHVSQAVSIANRYLQRDYHRLEEAGIRIGSKLFTLEESVPRLQGFKDNTKAALVIDDYIKLARAGDKVSAEIALEYVPATEHFEYHKNSQTYLMAGFTVTTPAATADCQRCLGCYATERERQEKPVQIQVANDRLSLLYREFDLVSVEYERVFFD